MTVAEIHISSFPYPPAPISCLSSPSKAAAWGESPLPIMTGSWEDIIAEPQLLQVSESLEVRRIYELY